MKLIKTQDAVGHVLAHDMTKIIPGEFKGAAFKKGHIVEEKDIPVLLSMGKENLYVWEKKEGILHEDEAAEILKEICLNEGMTAGDVSEGKIEIKAAVNGLLKIDRQKLKAVNSIGEMMIATRHGDFPVAIGDKIAGTRIIPLVIEKEKMEKAKKLAGEKPILSILPFKLKTAGIVTTGNEVAKGLIKDSFGGVVRNKLEEYGVSVQGQVFPGDDSSKITDSIKDFIAKGADLVLCTGGMSVDPDDKTPGAIKSVGVDVVSYGAPVLPGAMFLLSYYNVKDEAGNIVKKVPVLGLPGCVMYAKRTIFDLLLPRVLAEDTITAEDIAEYGEGGLCLGCNVCTFPNCGFGK